MELSLSALPLEIVIEFIIPGIDSRSAKIILSNNELIKSKGWGFLRNNLDVRDLFTPIKN